MSNSEKVNRHNIFLIARAFFFLFKKILISRFEQHFFKNKRPKSKIIHEITEIGPIMINVNFSIFVIIFIIENDFLFYFIVMIMINYKSIKCY